MRVNCSAVLSAFQSGKAYRRCASIWTDGNAIYSYVTVLVVRLGAGNVAINRTRYSTTTTIHQNALAAALRYETALSLYDVPRGTPAYRLQDRIEAARTASTLCTACGHLSCVCDLAATA